MAKALRYSLVAVWLMTSILTGAEPVAKRVLLVSQGPDGHPPQTHEYVAGVRVLAACLRGVAGLEVRQAYADGSWPEGPELIRNSDGVVLFLSEGAKWIHEEPQRLEALGQLAGRGGGFVAVHWAMGTRDARYIAGFLELFGGCHGGEDRKYQVLKTGLRIATPGHPIVTGLNAFDVRDEFYYDLKFVDASRRIEPLLQAEIDGAWHPVAWAWQRGDGGRSFGFSGLHFHDNWRLVPYRRLLAQGILWTLKLPVPADGLPVDVPEAELVLE
jgi:type 1 glutamine amidotransferase